MYLGLEACLVGLDCAELGLELAGFLEGFGAGAALEVFCGGVIFVFADRGRVGELSPDKVGAFTQGAPLALKGLPFFVEGDDARRVRGESGVVALEACLFVEVGVLPYVLDVDYRFGSCRWPDMGGMVVCEEARGGVEGSSGC